MVAEWMMISSKYAFVEFCVWSLGCVMVLVGLVAARRPGLVEDLDHTEGPDPGLSDLFLTLASSSRLAELGNGGCFFLVPDEEWWTFLVLEL